MVVMAPLGHILIRVLRFTSCQNRVNKSTHNLLKR